MGLRHPPTPSFINRSHPSTRIHPSTPSTTQNLNNISPNTSNSNQRVHSSSMVTNYTRDNLIELNTQADGSCLVVISHKVYDLTLWIEDQLDSIADQLRHLARVDPLTAGSWLVERLGHNHTNPIAECRIGDFDPIEHHPAPIHQLPACLDPGGDPLNPSARTQNVNTHPDRNSMSTDQQFTSSPSLEDNIRPESNCSNPNDPLPRRSHLSRALALVEYHKSLVIAAEANVGSAHVSLAGAFEGLAEAEKKRDHLVMLACEGFRPTLPEWESTEEEEEEDGIGLSTV